MRGGGWPGVSGEAAAACCGRLLSLSVSWGSVKATTAAWPPAHGAENVVPLKISFFLFPSGFLRRVGATWGGRGVRAGSACHFSLHLGTSSASDTVRKGGKKKNKSMCFVQVLAWADTDRPGALFGASQPVSCWCWVK